ncbi:MAG: SPOR domain-containing protein [Gammaproteobacteria bacterium]|nr:SPOR domain-containing protein [Gammaproteobacteria bacterium]MDH5651232.1 SPOR domain-containing protein [Gammaproteobacteria bacterium]
MKWMISVLLLVNLGIFVWHYQRPDTQAGMRELEDGTTRLVLLRENRDSTGKQPATAETQGQSRLVCYSLGPFEQKESAEKAIEAFRAEKIPTRQRVDRDAIRSGYWVYLPPAESRQQANHSLARLKQAKARDYFLVATGQMKNAISLGVFSKAKLAKARMEELNDQGFNARVEKVTLPKRMYWLDWEKLQQVQPSAQLLASLREQFKGVGQTERVCAPGAGNSGR